MKRLILRLVIFISPILLLFILYFYIDPFKMVYHYNIATWSGNLITGGNVSANRDYKSTEDFLDNYKNHLYTSFIFGNSKSLMFITKEWSKHIKDTGCFHWDASGESLYGIEKKLNFLVKENIKIKNALIVIDPPTFLGITNRKGHMFITHYKLTGQNYFAFQFECMQDFFDPDFLLNLVKNRFNVNNNVMKSVSKDNFETIYCDTFTYDKINNELTYYSLDKMLKENEDRYYQIRIKNKIFYKRDTTMQYHNRYIYTTQKNLLNNMNRIFKEHKTNFKIVISPAFDPKKIDTTDLKYLEELFGKDRVYDFSGINELNMDMHNFYDGHYKSSVANRIMNIIYSPNAEDSMRNLFHNYR